MLIKKTKKTKHTYYIVAFAIDCLCQVLSIVPSWVISRLDKTNFVDSKSAVFFLLILLNDKERFKLALLKNLYLLMIYKRLNMKPFKWFSLHWNLERRTGCGGQRTHASVGQILERHLNSLCSHSFSGELPEGKKNILNKPTHRMESLITAEHGHSNCRTWTHLKHHFYLFCYFETWGAGWGNTQILQCVSFLQHHSSSCVECVYGNRLCIYFNLYNQSPWLKSSRGNIWIFPNNSWCKKK